MSISESVIQKLKAVPDSTVIGMAISIGIKKDVNATMKMIRDGITDNSQLMTEILGEDLLTELLTIWKS